MTRTTGILLVLLVASATAGEPIPPSLVTIEDHPRTVAETMDFLKKQCGLVVDVSKVDGSKTLMMKRETPQPFWNALDKYAAAAGLHVEATNRGKSISLLPGKAATAASVDGPFRIVAKNVVAKADSTNGAVNYEVTLEINWEPRFPVFRIDSQPTITEAIDDRGAKLPSATAKSKSAIGDACSSSTTVKLDGLTRDSKKIAKLDGSFTVTASPKMLSFTFDDFAKLPVEKKDSEVSITLSKFTADAAELKLHYPDSHPQFESFESWADGNKLKLISPDRTKTIAPEHFSILGQANKLTAEYRFRNAPADRTGWTLAYETPAPLTEYSVKFSLRDIALP